MSCNKNKTEKQCGNQVEFLGCGISLDSKCVIYNSENLKVLDIVSGDSLETTIKNLDNILRDMYLSIQDGGTIKNVGKGISLYKDKNNFNEQEFRSIVSEKGILITQNEDTVEINIDERWLKKISPDFYIENIGKDVTLIDEYSKGAYTIKGFTQGDGIVVDSNSNDISFSVDKEWLKENTYRVENVRDYGAKCDGKTDDTIAVESFFEEGKNVVLNEDCIISDPQLLSHLSRSTGMGSLVYKGIRYPAGDITEFLKLPVPSVFSTIELACRFLDKKRILGNSGVDIMVEDGNYSVNKAIELRCADGAKKVTIRGNENNPEKCVINLDVRNNTDGFLFKDGYGVSWLNGFKIQGENGWISKGEWNKEVYGAGIRAIGGGSVVNIGGKMIIDKCYYGIRAMEGSVIHANTPPREQNVKGGGVIVTNAGDVAFHAYAATLECNSAEAYDTAHNHEGLGFGFCAEAGGLIICEYTKASGNLRAGHYALSKGTAWAHGVESYWNEYGVLSWGGHVECNSLGNFKTNIFENKNHGVYATYNGFVGANSAISQYSKRGSGFKSDRLSLIDITATVSKGNYHGYHADGGTITGSSAVAELSIDNGFFAENLGTISGENLLSKNNAEHGFYAKSDGKMIVPNLKSEGDKTFAFPIPDSKGLINFFDNSEVSSALGFKADINASNIDRELWRNKLGVGDLPLDIVKQSDLQDYISLDGTLSDNRLSGDINIQDKLNVSFKNKHSNIRFDEDGTLYVNDGTLSGNVYIQGVDFIDGGIKSSKLSSNLTDYSFIQKVYVDESIANTNKLKSNVDASNINVDLFRDALKIKDLPSNLDLYYKKAEGDLRYFTKPEKRVPPRPGQTLPTRLLDYDSGEGIDLTSIKGENIGNTNLVVESTGFGDVSRVIDFQIPTVFNTNGFPFSFSSLKSGLAYDKSKFSFVVQGVLEDGGYPTLVSLDVNKTVNDIVDSNFGVKSKLDKPTTNNTSDYVITGDGGTKSVSSFKYVPPLDDVLGAGSVTKKYINFLDTFNFGVSPDTYSIQLGNMNPAHKGAYNFAMGYDALKTVDNASDNLVIGSYSLNKVTDGRDNVSLGNYNLSSITHKYTAFNVLLGNSIGFNLLRATGNVFIGHNNGGNLKEEIAGSDIRNIAPAAEEYMKALPLLSGYDSATDTYAQSMNTFVGSNINANTNTPTRAAMSTIIGASPISGSRFRNFNNIVVGAGNYSVVPNSMFNNSIIIGNSINLPNQVDTLAIGLNSKQRINAEQAIIYGRLPNEELRFNAPVKLSPNHTPNANNDSTFIKNVVAKSDGTLGLVNSTDPNVYEYEIIDGNPVLIPKVTIVVPEGIVNLRLYSLYTNDNSLIKSIILSSTVENASLLGSNLGISSLILNKGVTTCDNMLTDSLRLKKVDLPETLKYENAVFDLDLANNPSYYASPFSGVLFSECYNIEELTIRTNYMLEYFVVFTNRKMYYDSSIQASVHKPTNLKVLYVPSALVQKYKADPYWSKYTTNLEILPI